MSFKFNVQNSINSIKSVAAVQTIFMNIGLVASVLSIAWIISSLKFTIVIHVFIRDKFSTN